MVGEQREKRRRGGEEEEEEGGEEIPNQRSISSPAQVSPLIDHSLRWRGGCPQCVSIDFLCPSLSDLCLRRELDFHVESIVENTNGCYSEWIWPRTSASDHNFCKHNFLQVWRTTNTIAICYEALPVLSKFYWILCLLSNYTSDGLILCTSNETLKLVPQMPYCPWIVPEYFSHPQKILHKYVLPDMVKLGLYHILCKSLRLLRGENANADVRF